MDKNIGSRIRMLREHIGLQQEEFSNKISITRTSLSRYETGLRSIPDSVKQSLLQFGTNLHWLLTGEGNMFLPQHNKGKDEQPSQLKSKTELNADKLKQYIELGKSNSKVEVKQTNKSQINSSVVSLPIVGEIAAGNPLEVNDMSDLGNIIVSTELISDPDNFYCFRVNGWSMSPEIQHSDVVIINKFYDYDDMDNRIVAVRIDDGITLKLLKLDHDNKCSWLMPINDDYKPILINQYSTINILGVLEYSIRSYK